MLAKVGHRTNVMLLATSSTRREIGTKSSGPGHRIIRQRPKSRRLSVGLERKEALRERERSAVLKGKRPLPMINDLPAEICVRQRT